jgi:putative membrane protein
VSQHVLASRFGGRLAQPACLLPVGRFCFELAVNGSAYPVCSTKYGRACNNSPQTARITCIANSLARGSAGLWRSVLLSFPQNHSLMKRSFLPLLATGLLALASCGENKTTSAENGNASDNTMTSSATSGDTVSATMPAGSENPENQPQSAGSAQGTGGNGAAKGINDGNAMSNGGMAGGAAMGDPNGPTGPHKDDKEFMMTAAHSDQNEIQQSKMALAKGVTGMAKEMANKMIADHTKSTADLKAIATKKGVTLPKDMDAEHKALAPTMEKLSGKEFEAKYISQMQADHQKTANTMRAHEKMTQDADLKAFIGKTVPVVEQHLGMAQKGSDMKM